MYLKNIEIQGFKSFAKKIVFDFHEGITGIVGPNGSGKSNVADAVRWVFGEQKVKQLRGGSMQDVIFSGTELRKPLSYASVSITLDNSDHKISVDYEEVTITRKLYRSGESEYAINGSTCRLKDINEMFYDTGIGKEGYSIIGQGQIDKILSGKPEERRELFDEAVGIVKFKKRKNLSVKKLEDERQNLTRVNDILSEIEKQIGPLEKQSIVAKQYLDKKQELKVYDINMFLVESDRLKNLITEVEQNIADLTEEYKKTETSYENMKEEYELAEDEIDDLNSQIETLKHQLSETNILKQQLQGKIAVIHEQINTVKMNDEHIGNRSIALQEDIRIRENEAETLQQNLEVLSNELQEESKKATKTRNELNLLQSQINENTIASEQMKQQIIELLNDRASTKAKLQRFDTMLEQGQIRKSQINRSLLEIQTEKSDIEKSLEKHVANYKSSEDKIQNSKNKISAIETEIVNLKGLITQSSAKQEDLQTQYHREQSRLESLKNITERYDGYGNSIRKVMERKSQVPGILGVVADIIKTEKKYEIAIETALGGSIQNIVTDSDQTAKQMVQYLKTNKLGRATFLPLTSIKGGQNIRYPEVLKEEGVLGIASTLVSVDTNYVKLAENLLGRTIVVNHIDNGLMLGKKYQHSLRIVTLDGELLNPGGSITGGAFKNSSNLLSRRREIEDLTEKVLMLKNTMLTCIQKLNADKDKRNILYQNLDTMKSDMQKLQMLNTTFEMNVNQNTTKIQEINHSFNEITEESKELEQQNISLRENIRSINDELNQSNVKESETTNGIQKLHSVFEQLKVQETEAIRNNESIQLLLVSAKQKHDFVNENFIRLQNEIAKYKEELHNLNINKSTSTSDINNKMNEIADIEKSLVTSDELIIEINQEIEQTTSNKEIITQKHKALLNKRETVSKHLAELDKESFRLTSKQEDYEELAEKNINYMWEEYEITYNYAMELRDPNMVDLEMMKREIKTLKQEIKALGSVNVNAIEDFKEISERYTFLKTQHDDLIEAEQTLMDIIHELDTAMREQFKSQFELICIEYDKVFKQLFGGGKGTLELMEDEDILEAGIKIIAQPPGKKLQNMMQLSGGEKALTAISLLFAIQNLKPSPFCLLDEIEAALDDSNVVRYAQYLHKLTKHTQFIVITHRRGTMTAADRLYGITMQEKGVSTLVSVDLLQDELEQ